LCGSFGWFVGLAVEGLVGFGLGGRWGGFTVTGSSSKRTIFRFVGLEGFVVVVVVVVVVDECGIRILTRCRML